MEILLESLKLGIAPSIVVAIYLVLNKVIEARRESKQAKVNINVVESFNKLNNFLDYITKDIIAKESDRRDLAIKNAFDRFENSIVKFSLTTIVNNHIDINKENILDNAKHTILSEFYALQSALALYSPEESNLSTYVKVDWQDEIYKDIIDIIYKEKFTKDQKIYALYNKVNIRVNEYKSIILKEHFNVMNK